MRVLARANVIRALPNDRSLFGRGIWTGKVIIGGFIEDGAPWEPCYAFLG